MTKRLKVLGSNTFANVVSVLALIVACLTLSLTQRQLDIQNTDTMILTRDGVANETVFLGKDGASYYLSIPCRVILTNRSERSQPLLEVVVDDDQDGAQGVREISDGRGGDIVLPLNLPANESRVLSFYLRVPLTLEQGEYLLANLPSPVVASANAWPISSLLELTRVFLGMENESMKLELLQVRSQGTVTYHFATTRDGNPFQLVDRYTIP